MKSYKGILLLTVSIVLTVYIWLATGMTNFVTPGLALTTLSWTFMLATRSRLLEKLFNGIERMYAIHKFFAILISYSPCLPQNRYGESIGVPSSWSARKP